MFQTINKPLHLLIDGADKLGKTTVIEILKRQLNLPVIKMPNMKEYIENNNAEEFSKLFNETIVQFAEYSFIMDRGFTSSIVYSAVFDRDFKLGYISNIEQILDPNVIILTGYNRQIGRAGESFGKDEIVKNEINRDKIEKEFNKLADRRGYTLIDVKGKSPIQICNEIITSLGEGFPV